MLYISWLFTGKDIKQKKKNLSHHVRVIPDIQGTTVVEGGLGDGAIVKVLIHLRHLQQEIRKLGAFAKFGVLLLTQFSFESI